MKHLWPVILRVVIGGVFIWAGVVKAWDPSAFAQIVDGYSLLPYTGAVMVALYLPWLEIACGVTLVIGRLRSGSVAILSTLLLIFIAALLSAWWRGLDIDCGCFGSTTNQINYAWPLLRDLLLLSGLFLVFILRSDHSICTQPES